MEYYFNEIDPFKFQRLINSILDARYGDNFRTTPLRGADGGRDGETAPGNPFLEYHIDDDSTPQQSILATPKNGRYLFQVKHHRTIDTRSTDARRSVLADFESELKNNVLTRSGDEQVNFFFLITNVSSSSDALSKLDKQRKKLLRNRKHLHADIWWKDQIVAFLDRMPDLWNSFPEIFAGGRVPFLSEIITKSNNKLSRSIRIALKKQYRRDKIVKFRQIGLETELSKLFVDLDINLEHLPRADQRYFSQAELDRFENDYYSPDLADKTKLLLYTNHLRRLHYYEPFASALSILLNESNQTVDRHETKSIRNKYILEGGPGQGKSTITQMALQIYRQALLLENELDPEHRWVVPGKIRFPIRIELRKFAEWLFTNPDTSVEKFLTKNLNEDSGTDQINVEHLHDIIENSPVFLVFDGLDEIGSDDLRDQVILKIRDCVQRFEEDLKADLCAIVTTRPPAIVGRQKYLTDFVRLPISLLSPQRIEEYVERWLSVHLEDEEEQLRVREAFENRRKERHVQALIQTPMQLSVLLHFIKLKDEAFPDHRAKLYKEYFQIVIDRDVAKSPELRNDRDLIESLHEFLGYKLHALTETQEADGTLERTKLLALVGKWLVARGDEAKRAEEIFKLGEDRLGLIVTAKGEGKEGRYGYEIQPVREYFAAAFINNQIQGNANDIFEAMVHRPYWKEVALFLAGLRRPNEKADLVTRAGFLDTDDNFGWRQDGRALILQLLQEGVLSEPTHVFLIALDKVFDLLDPRAVKVQKEPENLLTSLSDLICTLSGSNRSQFSEKLLRLIHELHAEEDEYMIYRAYRVASSIMDHEVVRQKLLAHNTTNPNLVAKLRLAWPFSWGLNMEESTYDQEYWEGVPDNCWAYWWWGTAFISNISTKINAPVSLHHFLFIEFATNPIFPDRFRSTRESEVFKTYSKWAIWKLVNYYQNLRNFSLLSEPDALEKHKIWILEEVKTPIDFSGLDDAFSDLSLELIDIYQDVLVNIVLGDGSSDPENILSKYLPILKKNLNRQGLIGWITYKCCVNLLESLLRYNTEKNPRTSGFTFSSIIEEMLLTNHSSKELFENMQIYNRRLSDKNEPGEVGIDYLFHTSRSLFSRRLNQTPNFIRLDDAGDLISIVDILARSIRNNSKAEFDFLNKITFTTEIIRPLVDQCKDHLPSLLLWLSKASFTRIGSGKPLTIQRVNQILKITRDSNDQDQLGGAFIALSTSKFIKSAGVDVLLKLCRFDSHGIATSRILFNSPESTVFSERVEIDHEEIKIMEEAANEIIKKPELYKYRLVCGAAKYLVDSYPLNLPPLADKEQELMIYV